MEAAETLLNGYKFVWKYCYHEEKQIMDFFYIYKIFN